MKYKKKPVVIEAWKLNHKDSADSTPRWMQKALLEESLYYVDNHTWHILTLEGEMIAEDGDYLIQGVHGELYSCKPDIFEETYSDVSQLEENQERIITLDSYKDISLELVLMNDEVSEYRVTGCLENGWSYWFTDFEEAVNSYNELKIER